MQYTLALLLLRSTATLKCERISTYLKALLLESSRAGTDGAAASAAAAVHFFRFIDGATAVMIICYYISTVFV